MRTPISSNANRRAILRFLAGGVLLATAARPSVAGTAKIDRLIAAVRGTSAVSERIAFISGALKGTRYLADTLVGGPRRPERFVLYDDAFDCVTFCETVLAAAIADSPSGFPSALRFIRYHNGFISWRTRNHYFSEWARHNIESGICRPIEMDGAIRIEKDVFWHRALGRRHFSMIGVPRAAFWAGSAALQKGDIIGFITRRPNLDYFHVGFIVFGENGELLLRHASQRHRMVLDERMDDFMTANHVRHVTVLRPQRPAIAMAN
ncbi:MAG TPA: N-acetylmuramoyl-L-alanine amidase-like domain-containing protein [Pseudolabrys sp.]|nr:N-acetylmuramoyl-L-alanine amidase-like domain-containing protein [Pseudolabrys sp.]